MRSDLNKVSVLLALSFGIIKQLVYMLKNKKSLIVWLALGLIGLATFILYYNQAFPTASLDIRVNKKEAIQISGDFIREQGFDLSGFDKSILFFSDYYATSYLQKTQGLKKSNELIRKGLPVWFWRIRWFKELEKEGFIVDVDPADSRVLNFDYFVLEDKPGAKISKKRAMNIAVEKIRFQGVELSDYELKDTTIKKQKNRIDYHFVWEKKDYKIDEATLRLNVRIYGDKLGRYREFLKVPETFGRYIEGEISFGKTLKVASLILVFIVGIIAIFILAIRKFLVKAHWKFWFICGCIVFLLKISDFFNSLPLVWSFYYDTISKEVFFMASLGEYLTGALSTGVMVFAYGLLGELFLLPSDKSLLFKILNNKTPSGVISTIVVSYSLSFICLGYLTLFYLLGGKIFNIWMPLKSEYSNVLGMSIPLLFPLTLALIAAIYEEFTYRLFITSFLKKFARLSWLAILIPALLWGLAHSFYLVFPIYVRCIELTILGILFSIIFLKYGIEIVIVAHFLVNVILASMPFWQAHDTAFFIYGIAIAFFVLAPAVIIPIVSNIYKKKEVKG